MMITPTACEVAFPVSSPQPEGHGPGKLPETQFHGNFGPALMTPRAFYRDQFDGQTE
jgi:hypothetical protein